MSTSVSRMSPTVASSWARPSATPYECSGMTTRPPRGTSENAAAIAAIPEANPSAGSAVPSSAASAASSARHVSVSLRV